MVVGLRGAMAVAGIQLRIIHPMWDSDLELENKVVADVMRDGGGGK